MHIARANYLGYCLVASLALGTLGSACIASVASRLDGRTFLLDSAKGFEPVEGTTVRLSFNDDGLSISAGCNSQGGPYKVQDDRLIVSGFGSTEIGCEEPLHAQDQFLAEFLTSSPQLKLVGDKLTLTGKAASLVFLDRVVADPDRSLQGRVWTIDTFIDGDSASNFPGASEATIEFGNDGQLQVDTTCNTGTGHFSVSGDELTLIGVGFTKKGCSGTAASVENSIRAVISDGAVEFEIEAARLTLTRGKAGLGAHTP